MRSSVPPHKRRPDSPFPTLQGPCDWSQKCRWNLTFLHQLEMRPSSIAPYPVESREAPPNSTVSLILRGTLRSSLRSLSHVEWTQGFLLHSEKDLESPSLPSWGPIPYHDWCLVLMVPKRIPTTRLGHLLIQVQKFNAARFLMIKWTGLLSGMTIILWNTLQFLSWLDLSGQILRSRE